jgi:anti-sigma B factor antagonist
MDFDLHITAGPGGALCAALAGELTIYTAAQCKDRLIESLGMAASAELDLSAVSDIDTAGIQVLLVARRHAQSLGKNVRLTALSQPVLQLVDLYNLGAALGLHTEERQAS